MLVSTHISERTGILLTLVVPAGNSAQYCLFNVDQFLHESAGILLDDQLSGMFAAVLGKPLVVLFRGADPFERVHLEGCPPALGARVHEYEEFGALGNAQATDVKLCQSRKQSL